jgi:hypothetical protein
VYCLNLTATITYNWSENDCFCEHISIGFYQLLAIKWINLDSDLTAQPRRRHRKGEILDTRRIRWFCSAIRHMQWCQMTTLNAERGWNRSIG